MCSSSESFLVDIHGNRRNTIYTYCTNSSRCTNFLPPNILSTSAFCDSVSSPGNKSPSNPTLPADLSTKTGMSSSTVVALRNNSETTSDVFSSNDVDDDNNNNNYKMWANTQLDSRSHRTLPKENNRSQPWATGPPPCLVWMDVVA